MGLKILATCYWVSLHGKVHKGKTDFVMWCVDRIKYQLERIRNLFLVVYSLLFTVTLWQLHIVSELQYVLKLL